MFAYCNNNAVMLCDPTGEVPVILAAIPIVLQIVIGVGVVCATALAVYIIIEVAGEIVDSIDTIISYKKSKPKKNRPLPNQGKVSEIPEAPPVDAGKQGKHVKGYNNNTDPGKSTWPEGKNGVRETQEAWNNGIPDSRYPKNVRIGESDAFRVRVHMDGDGSIHGYPIFLK